MKFFSDFFSKLWIGATHALKVRRISATRTWGIAHIAVAALLVILAQPHLGGMARLTRTRCPVRCTPLALEPRARAFTTWTACLGRLGICLRTELLKYRLYQQKQKSNCVFTKARKHQHTVANCTFKKQKKNILINFVCERKRLWQIFFRAIFFTNFLL